MRKVVKTVSPRPVRRRIYEPQFASEEYEQGTQTVHKVAERLREKIATMSKEELAEKLTTYEPGVPHFWFGRPVEPITKEELLAYWNGGPEPQMRYKDVPQPQLQAASQE